MKVHGAAWAANAGMTLYDAYGNQTIKEQPALIAAAVAGVLSAMCLYRGFKEDDDTVKVA